MKLVDVCVYRDTLIDGEDVERFFDGDNMTVVEIREDDLKKLIASETDYKDFKEFVSEYTCDDTDGIIRAMQKRGGTIYCHGSGKSLEYKLMKAWNAGTKLKIERW